VSARGRPLALGCALGLFAAGALACLRGGDGLEVGRLTVSGPGLGAGDADVVARALRQGPPPGVRFVDDGAPVQLVVSGRADDGVLRIVVGAEQTTKAGDGGARRRLRASGARPMPEGPDAVVPAVIEAAREALGALEAVRAVDALDRRALVARLGGPEGPALEAAVDRVRDEAIVEARAALLARLGPIADVTVARALVASARGQPPAYVSALVFALSRVGGREAEAYLFTVASGHPDERLRASAREALDELTRRSAARPEPP
jgi:hypothetical protein